MLKKLSVEIDSLGESAYYFDLQHPCKKVGMTMGMPVAQQVGYVGGWAK